MNPKDQEALFQKVQERFPKWSPRKCSGYVHGILDEERHKRPENRQVKAFSPSRTYSMGYVCGFIDARGIDAYDDSRLERFRTIHPMTFRWWDDV